MWTTPDPDVVANYDALPEPLKLKEFLRLVDATPTGWISILRSTIDDAVHSTITCALVPSDSIEAALSHTDWDEDLGSSWNWVGDNPGFDDGLTKTHNGYTLHFFAQARRHSGYVEPTIELTPSFVWWLRLIEIERGHWIRLDDAGRKHTVVTTTRRDDDSWDVKVSALLLRRYLAARQMGLLVQHRHTVYSTLDDVDRIDLEHRSTTASIDFCATDSWGATELNFFSDMFGKHVVLPLAQTGEGPDDTLRPERFQDFIIGTDTSTGEPVRWTCDVADDIGRSPVGEPNFLAPVYFDTEVLTRYRDDPQTYVLSRTRLSCLNLWGLDLDINDENLVQLWLGDIKQQLPESEREHWLQYNVPPREGHVSEARFRRDVLNQWDVDDPRPNLDHLRRARRDLNIAVLSAHGVELYKKLSKDDQREFDGLALCTNDSIGQRDLSFLVLTKAVVDAIDVRTIRSLAGADKSETSLNALQSWVEQMGGDVDELCGPLRLLQSMRSSGAAHLKGSRYSAALAAEGWEKLPPSKQFEDLVDRITRALRGLSKLVASAAETSQ
ncbi:hypothetical protein CH263_20150 [Rhodococcus sp. 06-1059B-a]|nr:hypothetical protein [Rhodococcus sp. 06-1059B-a]OZD60805.1 hypothetical protein CH263_20150 [Rhodococcus sp. 06-1059B-a]